MWARTRTLLVVVVSAAAALAVCAGAPADVIDSGAANTVAVNGDAITIEQITTKTPASANDIDSSKDEIIEARKKVALTTTDLRYSSPHAVLFGRTCGGTIISPKWVLTAGHCTLFSSGHSVLAGTNITDDGSGVKRRIKRLILHPRFTVGPYWVDAEEFGIKQVSARFDFLLAELEDPLPLDGTTIASIPLDDQLSHPRGIDVSYAGYGASNHGETMRHTMHTMELHTMDDESCARKLVEFDKQDMICVKGRPPRFDSACNGDSGSGLVGEGRLMGVASWVEDDAFTCRPGAIVVFSRVAAARDWIRQVTGV